MLLATGELARGRLEAAKRRGLLNGSQAGVALEACYGALALAWIVAEGVASLSRDKGVTRQLALRPKEVHRATKRAGPT